MHENLPEQVKNKTWISEYIRTQISWLIMIFERLSLNRFAVIFAENSYANYYPWVQDKVTVLNLPLIDTLQNLSTKSDSPKNDKLFKVGYIGGVTINRGVDVTISALESVRKKYLNVLFECIGPVDSEVEDLASFQKGISEGWINAYGRLPAKDGWPIIAQCDVGIALLKPIGNYVGSYPTKMFEYMAMGMPVIVSDFEIYKIIIDQYHCGFAVDPLDKSKVASTIIELIENESLQNELSKNGIEAVKREFNWNTEFKKLLALYSELIRGKEA
jgi:glycosyltransferase involved in cell wall biosynthesis